MCTSRQERANCGGEAVVATGNSDSSRNSVSGHLIIRSHRFYRLAALLSVTTTAPVLHVRVGRRVQIRVHIFFSNRIPRKRRRSRLHQPTVTKTTTLLPVNRCARYFAKGVRELNRLWKALKILASKSDIVSIWQQFHFYRLQAKTTMEVTVQYTQTKRLEVHWKKKRRQGTFLKHGRPDANAVR